MQNRTNLRMMTVEITITAPLLEVCLQLPIEVEMQQVDIHYKLWNHFNC